MIQFLIGGFYSSIWSMNEILSLMCVFFVRLVPSVLWCCWMGGRKGIRPVKNWVVGCWHDICLKRGGDLRIAQLMQLPLTVSCSSKSRLVLPEWFCFSGVNWT